MTTVRATFLIMLVVAGLFFLFQMHERSSNVIEKGIFALEIADRDGPVDPWGKSIGDLDQDGRIDIIVGGHTSRELVYYSGDDFDRKTISTGYQFSTDHEAADIDADGHVDVVSLTGKSLLIFYGPDWQVDVVENLGLHDIEVADLDKDGRLDLVGRNQGAFGDSGDHVFVFKNTGTRGWEKSNTEIGDGEGLALADLNGDGLADIIVNQYWLENSGHADVSQWPQHRYTDTWSWPNATIAIGDINSDGLLDIAAAPAELAGQRYRISWFQAPDNSSEIWSEHVLEDNVEAVHHSLQAVDVNLDRRVDVVTAEMHQGDDPDEVSVYFNEGRGTRWTKSVLGHQGSHGIRVGDLDGDGDPDLIGANWSGDDQSVYVWRNLTCSIGGGNWKRRVIDPDQRWTSLFITSGDLDGDGWHDVVSGAWWYRNPGPSSRHWTRHRITHGPFNAALLADINDDGKVDIFGTQGQGTLPSGSLLFGINDGSGSFQTHEVGSVVGDFLQGVAEGRSGDSRYLVLSWHREDTDLYMLDLSDGIARARTRALLGADLNSNEAISLVDFNNDGTLDIVLGTSILLSEEKGYSLRNISSTNQPPDRNVVVDVDQDGLTDIVVGFESIDKIGPVKWFRNPGGDGRPWVATTIAEIIGPMSLDAGDIDLDGDIDVVVGEHNLSNPEQARLFFFENVDGKGASWTPHVVYTGDEHHDGAQLKDIDKDGDLDILSIGWSHNRVMLYENQINQCK